MKQVNPSSTPRVVIIGAGFGGLNAAKALRRAAVQITLIDRYNYHLFQPLLYQVATAGLSPADISMPVRQVFSRQHNCQVLMGEVVAVDRQQQLVKTRRKTIPYDYLIIATGARHAYFGHDEWQAHAPGLKDLDDATTIRKKILLAFEQAELSDDPEERRRLMNFCVIGGGPTGVEMAGAVAELANHTLSKDFRHIDPTTAAITLLEGGDRLLTSFPEQLSEKARLQLVELGVEVRLNSLVTRCDEHGVTIADGSHIPTQNIIWAAGVKASPAAEWLGVPADRAGRVKVSGHLSLPESPNVFVIGDTAQVVDAKNNPVPGVAPAAKQMGKYVGRVIKRSIKQQSAPQPFRYKDYGNLATIGRKAAVADFGFMRLSGLPAWWLWGGAHVFFLIGFRNRLSVMMNWAWHYFSFKRGARLITGQDDEQKNPKQFGDS